MSYFRHTNIMCPKSLFIIIPSEPRVNGFLFNVFYLSALVIQAIHIKCIKLFIKRPKAARLQKTKFWCDWFISCFYLIYVVMLVFQLIIFLFCYMIYLLTLLIFVVRFTTVVKRFKIIECHVWMTNIEIRKK